MVRDFQAEQREKLRATAGWARRVREVLGPIMASHGDRVHFRPGATGFSMVGLLPGRPQRGKSGLVDPERVASGFEGMFARYCRNITQGRSTPEKELQSYLIRESLAHQRRMLPLNAASTGTSDPVELFFIVDEIAFAAEDGKIVCDLLALRRSGSKSIPVLLELKSERSMARLVEQLEGYAALVEQHLDLFSDLYGAILGEDVRLDGPAEKWMVWPAHGEGPDRLEVDLSRRGIRVVNYAVSLEGRFCLRVGEPAGGPGRNERPAAPPQRPPVPASQSIVPHGPIYTHGASFRARAEARQREYRASILKVGHGLYGHVLDEAAANAGANFVLPEAHSAARVRDVAGKGVGARTFQNMLSSQAMCFNLFAPLMSNVGLATSVLQPFFPGLAAVRSVQIEYTPANEVFGDQTGRGGVDCDVRIDAQMADGEQAVVVIETKFVEREFSVCGYTKKGASRRCPTTEVCVRDDPMACLYSSQRRYRYWEQTRALDTLELDRLPERGCPFAGPLWQLWVNHTLAHVLAARSGASRALFAICASSRNRELLGEGNLLEVFRVLVREPLSLVFLDLDAMIGRIAEVSGDVAWTSALSRRYRDI